MRVDQPYRKKSEGKDIDPSISAEVKMFMMLVQRFNIILFSTYLII